MKRDAYASVYVHMRRGIPSPLHAAARILDDPISTKKHIKTFEYRIHWNINIRKNKFKKLNGSAALNKHSGKQC